MALAMERLAALASKHWRKAGLQRYVSRSKDDRWVLGGHASGRGSERDNYRLLRLLRIRGMGNTHIRIRANYGTTHECWLKRRHVLPPTYA